MSKRLEINVYTNAVIVELTDDFGKILFGARCEVSDYSRAKLEMNEWYLQNIKKLLLSGIECDKNNYNYGIKNRCEYT